MRVKREKISQNYIKNSNKQPKIYHVKTGSMDMISTSNSKSIYLNKILQKNLGTQKANIDQANFQKNFPNFQSSIQNILANEETLQKAKNFVLQMRNKQGQNSPISFHNDYLRNKNINLSKTNYNRFYDTNHNKNLDDIFQDKNYNNRNFRNNSNTSRDNKREVLYKQKISYPEFNNYININDQNIPDKVIRVNKIDKCYEEKPSISPNKNNNNNNIYFKSNLGINRNHSRGVFNYNNLKMNNINNISNNVNKYKSSNTNYPLSSNKRQAYYNNKQYTDIYPNKNLYNNIYNNSNNNIYNDDNDLEEGFIENFENNQNETNSASENDNSGLREIIIDNINEIYQSPEILNRNNDDYNYAHITDVKTNKNIKQNNYNNISTFNKYNPINKNKNISLGNNITNTSSINNSSTKKKAKANCI